MFMYLSLCLFVICVFNGNVAYASGEQLGSPTPTVEAASMGRYARTGITFAFAGELRTCKCGARILRKLRGFKLTKGHIERKNSIQICIAAKNTLNSIDYKLINEYNSIRQVDDY